MQNHQKRILLVNAALILLAALFPGHPAAASAQPDASEPDSGAVICPTGSYPQTPDDCLPLGPSESISNMAAEGIHWPITPLPAFQLGSDMSKIPYQYFKVDNAGTYLFSSLDSAANEAVSGQMIGPGHLLFVSYLERVDQGSGIFYYLDNGGWIRGEGARAGVDFYPPLRGLQFSSTPKNPFGWFIEPNITSLVAPGFSSPETNHTYFKYDVVQIYATQTVDNVDWYLIAPGEWVQSRYIGRVDPRSSSPEGIATPRWIEINLYEQTLAVYDNNQLVFATLVSTGADPFWTRPGVFSIYEKKESETMSGAFEADRSDYYYLQDVPWTMYFDGQRALHGAYWHNNFGYVTSHGCVNMSLADSHWLFDWTHNGDVVYVYDPSGQTPTDASLYGAGAP